MQLRKAEFWTRRQRRTLLGLCGLLLIFLGVENWRKPIHLDDPPLSPGVRAGQIQDRLDPNTAEAVELAAIPSLGEARARGIVEYREDFCRQHPGMPAFKSSADLMLVKGIGPGIVATMEPYLSFAPR